ncbi:coiled-coil domain-containing protein 102B-like [Talpa occidentalis]|uniref:coiled-coil domain-containing protein 102B-like n=1 Tax=Talpa occidentalis TaxID=50954 RepID=UPI0023F6B671|nr:coiled-coil domain-containing protein 102B-like [Talpa occidentalis]
MQELLLFTHVSVIQSRYSSPASPEGKLPVRHPLTAHQQRPEKINMNLDSIHRLIEETQIFQRQQPSPKSPSDAVAPASSPREPCNPCWPLQGLHAPPAPGTCAHLRGPSEWDIYEELRRRELDEVKARAAQMEKTMRWWSDCTANWREKWSKVRAERNSAREEGRQLRIKLEMTMKELSALKKKQSVAQPKEAREAEGSQGLRTPGCGDASWAPGDQGGEGPCAPAGEGWAQRELPAKSADSKEESLIIDTLRLNEELKLNLDYPDLFKNAGSENCTVKPGLRLQEINLPLENEVLEISALQGQLDEFQKISWKEREMRSSLEKEIVRLESALSVWKRRYEDLKESKTNSMNEFNILYGQHKNDIEEISAETKEGLKSQSSKDGVVCELRAEPERLQAEKTSEWNQREMFETEKQGLERENQRLKVQVKEMEELLGGKRRGSTTGLGLTTSQSDLRGPSKNSDSQLEPTIVIVAVQSHWCRRDPLRLRD